MLPPDNYLDILRDLRLLYAREPELRLKPTHSRVTHIAHGWYMRVQRSCDAVLLLRGAGYGAESWPMRRTIAEHVIGLKWLAAEGGKVADTVRRGLAFDAEKRRQALGESWPTIDLSPFDTVIADQAGTDHVQSDDYLLAFAHRCRAYGTAHEWSDYLLMTTHSHPGWETALPYLDTSGPDLMATQEPTFHEDMDDARLCAIQTWHALVAVNSMLDAPKWDDALHESGVRIQALLE